MIVTIEINLFVQEQGRDGVDVRTHVADGFGFFDLSQSNWKRQLLQSFVSIDVEGHFVDAGNR